ncbi:VOC family protein [Alloyangia pacifica]|uniref:VOC family protein n=1 Tax=Alloyangia pacifica TaxID=311180 RepID=UPI001CD55114|nr:VOC family protein [Alloyangia pacifica]MCA0997981.1 VOC family protein [Alloyangia pacifica]
MPNHHGDFIWYELMSREPDASEAFYAGLLGWSFEPADPSGDMDYRLFSKDGPPAGGLLKLPAEACDAGAQTMWAGYIGVDDVDASVQQMAERGSRVIMEPTTLQGVGRMALLHDPQGAPIYLMHGASDEPSQAFAQDAPREGHCAWNELRTPDPSAALEVYAACFGWEKTDSMDMGPAGSYDMLRNPPHASLLGAMMSSGDMPPQWLFYFRVADIDKAAAYIDHNGGEMLMGPQEIPGGEYILNARDPQGAVLALIGKRVA